MKKQVKWKKSEIIILILLSAIGIAAVFNLIRILSEYMDGSAVYQSLQEYVFLPDDDTGYPAEPDGQGAGSNRKPEQNAVPARDEAGAGESGYVHCGRPPKVDFESLKALNSDLTGWIYGPDTMINYPIVQGKDNDYYLTHTFDGKENRCGSIFMDSLNNADFTDTNNILHGHHMKNGSMFACLSKYADQSYYDTHPVLWLVTPEKTFRVDVFTGFVTKAEGDVWQIEFSDKEDYGGWLDKMTANSLFESDIKPETDDKIITLATCSYEYENARFVVMGILREGR